MQTFALNLALSNADPVSADSIRLTSGDLYSATSDGLEKTLLNRGRKKAVKKLTIMVVLAIGWVLIGSTVWADAYFAGQAGLFNPEDDSVLDSGYNLEAAYGRSLVDVFPGLAAKHPAWKNVSAELGLGYRHADGETSIASFGSTTTTKTDLDVVPITLAAVYTHALAGSPFKFYGGAGPGIYYAMTETKVTTTVPFIGTTTVSDDDSEFKFGLMLKGGVLFSLNDQLDLSGGLQMDLVSDDVGGICINIGVRYYF